jgi:hypothetical protein
MKFLNKVEKKVELSPCQVVMTVVSFPLTGVWKVKRIEVMLTPNHMRAEVSDRIEQHQNDEDVHRMSGGWLLAMMVRFRLFSWDRSGLAL